VNSERLRTPADARDRARILAARGAPGRTVQQKWSPLAALGRSSAGRRELPAKRAAVRLRSHHPHRGKGPDELTDVKFQMQAEAITNIFGVANLGLPQAFVGTALNLAIA